MIPLIIAGPQDRIAALQHSENYQQGKGGSGNGVPPHRNAKGIPKSIPSSYSSITSRQPVQKSAPKRQGTKYRKNKGGKASLAGQSVIENIHGQMLAFLNPQAVPSIVTQTKKFTVISSLQAKEKEVQ